jgi:hypothetical protein
MAFTGKTAAQLASNIITSIFGRRMGLDSSGILYGPSARVWPLYSVTSATTASALLPSYGIIIANTTDSSGTTAGWCIGAPIPGVQLKLINMSTGTAAFQIASSAGLGTSLVTGLYMNPAGVGLTSAVTLINMTSRGQSALLTGLTTVQWLVEAINSGSSITTYGTSVT